MGIQGLSKLLADNAPGATIEHGPKLTNYFSGRKVAIDASMCLYQFVKAMSNAHTGGALLTDANGETTTHLQGMFSRTIRYVSAGIRPCYVFDGKPPTLKSGELAKRSKAREEAEAGLKEAQESGNQEDMAKFTKRVQRVTRQHNDDTKKLLRLMGMPVVEAPCEAEAQCAALCKSKKVWATATEDMDALTFGTPILLRCLTHAESRKSAIKEVSLPRVLEEMNLDMDKFIDLCILCGCDYTKGIPKIGPKTAVDLIRKHGDIETILKNLDKSKYTVPDDFCYEEARVLFKEHEVLGGTDVELKWKDPDEEGLIKFMCDEKGFAVDRIQKGIEKLKKNRASGGAQGRLDAFFGPPTITKRKIVAPKGKNAKKLKKGKK